MSYCPQCLTKCNAWEDCHAGEIVRRDARIAELEKALREIKGMDVWSGFREGFCKMKYIATRALEKK